MRTLLAGILISIAAATNAFAVKITDITHLQGQRENRLQFVGLVVGLPGTGDGGKFLPAIRPLAAFLQSYGNTVYSLDELKNAKNVALVRVKAVIGPNGGREGQKLDVSISAIGSAKSLKGGDLVLTPLLGPHPDDPTVYAQADGKITIDPENPTTGFIKNGATLEQTITNQFIDGNTFTLVIDDSHASWAMASTIAMTINEAASVQQSEVHLAEAVDPKSVKVTIPQAERARPANFIAWIQGKHLLMPEKQAKVTINSRAGTVVIDGQVTISPVTICFKGMTISTKQLIDDLRKQAAADQGNQVAAMPDSVELRLLTDALQVMSVPVQDRIAIIRELARSGNLQGKLIEQP